MLAGRTDGQEERATYAPPALPARVDDVVENMAAAFVALDGDWRIVYMNREAERINGKRREDVGGKTQWEEWPASVGTEIERQYRRVMTERIAVHFEHRYYVPDEFDIWLDIHAYPTAVGGAGVGIYAQDITARKRAESRAHHLLTLTTELSAASTLEQVTRVLVEQGIVAAGAAAGSLAILTPGGAEFEIAYSVGIPEAAVETYRRFPLQAGRPLSDAVLARAPVLLPDANAMDSEYPDLAPAILATGFRALAVIPVMTMTGTRAGLTVMWKDPHPFDGPSRDFLATLGELCAQALERARLDAAERAAHAAAGEAWAESEAAARQLQEQAAELEAALEESQTLSEELERSVEEARIAAEAAERSRAEAAESERRFRATADAAPVMMWTSTADGQRDWFNQSWLDFTGRPIEQELGLGWSSGVHPDDCGEFLDAYFASLGARRSFEAEYRLRNRRGEYRWVLGKGVPRYAANGEFVGYVAMCLDITERRRAADASRASEARYRALVDASTLMVWQTGPDGMVEDMPFWRQLTGQSLEEVRGNGWAAAVHPEDRQRVADTWRRAYESRVAYEAEYRLRLKDGSYRWYRARGVPVFAEQGTLSEWVGVFNDVHDARREVEAAALLDRASVAFAGTLDVDAALGALARAAVPQLGDWCAVDVIVDSETNQWPPVTRRVAIVHEDVEKVRVATEMAARYPQDWSAGAGMPRVLRDGVPEFYPVITDEMIVAGARDAGHLALLRQLQFSSALIVPLVAGGRTLGALTLCMTESHRRYDDRDLTVALELARRAATAVETARLYQLERSARAEAEAASQAKSDLLAVVSHELRTPLSGALGHLDLLEMGLHGELTAAQAQAVERIKRSNRHLLSLVNDVLNFSRVTAGALSLDVQLLRACDVLADIEPFVRPQATSKGLDIDVETCPPSVVVAADFERLRQILLNLLSNAIKFTASGGGISIWSEAGETTVRFHVRDSGIGIPADKREAIFEPFVQVSSAHGGRSVYARSNEGLGLGLSISRQLARSMHGDLTVDGSYGSGSTFTLTLPTAMPDE